MTCIAWDGKTLAADKRASLGGLIRTTTKIFRVRDCLVGYSGEAAFGQQMVGWFRDGEQPADFPGSQRDKDDWAGLLVIRPDGKIQRYERTPQALTYEDANFAVGSGRDFAIAAMYLGKTAVEAVAVACALDSDCGNGIDALELE
jgi:20S proteasome alpha/beta subunit